MLPSKTSIVETIYFNSDNYRLKGELHLPPESNPPILIGSHGFLANRHSPKLITLAEQCNRHGIGMFRFDHRGCGESEGSFESGTSVQGRCNDLLSAIRHLQKMGQADSGIGLFGSSMGGATVLAAARRLNYAAIITYAAPIWNISPAKVSLAALSGEVRIIEQSNTRMRFDVELDLSAIHHLLVIHGDADTVVPISHGQELYQTAGQPKLFIVQKGGDHPMSLPAHQEDFAREAVSWLKRWF